MIKSVFSKVGELKHSRDRRKKTPDLKRVLGDLSERRITPDRNTPRPEQLNDWLRSDLDQLIKTMKAALDAPGDMDARAAFERAIHNLFGASGAYGGGALTRLSGSLQRLVGNTEHLTEIAPLINIHVKGCLAAVRAKHGSGEAISDAICETIEARVDKHLAAPQANDQTDQAETAEKGAETSDPDDQEAA